MQSTTVTTEQEQEAARARAAAVRADLAAAPFCHMPQDARLALETLAYQGYESDAYGGVIWLPAAAKVAQGMRDAHGYPLVCCSRILVDDWQTYWPHFLRMLDKNRAGGAQ